MNVRHDGKALPVAICVPVRDEALALPHLFAAVERLTYGNLAPTLCLLLDGCTDASGALAYDYAARASLPVLVEEVAADGVNAGRARHMAMLLGRRSRNGSGLLLTTDADSLPASDWLQATVGGLRHADVVAGKVIRQVTRPSPMQDRIEAYYDALHTLRRMFDPVAWEGPITHHYASGANLGLSAESYDLMGGFAPLSHGEDATLVDDAARRGLRVRRDAASVVYTSDRRQGRVSNGLAGNLRTLDHGGAPVEVAHPRDAVWQYCRHADARRAFDNGDFTRLATAIRLTIDHVVGVARDCPNGEAFAMQVVPTPPGGMRRVSLGTAEAELAALTAERQAA